MTGVQTSEIDFWATNIVDEQNGEARRGEIQCPSLLLITSVPVPDEVPDAKRRPIDKICRASKHWCYTTSEKAKERWHISANSVNSHLNSEIGSHMLGAQVIARSDTTNKDAIGVTNLLFGIQQLGKTRVKTKRFRTARLTSARSRTIHTKKRRSTTINNLTPTLNTEQEIPGITNVLTKETIKEHMRRQMLRGFDLIPVGKDDEGHYWPGFGPGVPHVTDWRKSKQQGQTPSTDDVRAFWREHNLNLRISCVRKKFDSEDDSETLQPVKITRQEFRNRFVRHRNRSISPHSKISRYDSPDRGNESRDRSGSRGYSSSREYQSSRETRTDADRNYNGFETRNESRGRGRVTHTGRGYNYQGRGQNYQEQRYREAQKYNPYTKQVFNKTKNPINWNKTHQFDDKNRGEGLDDNPNDYWTKRTPMQKDPPDNQSDKESTWTEDEAPQHQVAIPQPKQQTQQTQRLQQTQTQPKQQAPSQVLKKKGRKDQPPNQDDIDEMEVMQERLAQLQKEKEEMNIPGSESDCQQLVGAKDSNNNLTP
ncbi:MAG: hypothetical protein EZS28_037043, partial [Streblomastix strix]